MKTYCFIALLIFTNLLFAHGNKVEMEIEKGEQSLHAASPSSLTLGIYTDEGDPITDFEKDHAKEMHIAIISSDRSYFSHVHPAWRGLGSNLFDITLNEETLEFDNFQAPIAFPSTGEYTMYAEVKPKGVTSAGMAEVELEVLKGPNFIKQVPNDHVSHKKIISKYFKIGAIGSSSFELSNETDYNYKIDLAVSTMMMNGEKMLHFDLKVYMRHLMGGMWMDHPLKHKHLMNWLEMPGHAILVSDKHEDFFHMHYPYMGGGHGGGGHNHSVDPESTTFSFMKSFKESDLNKLSKKNISLWVQFRLADQSGAFDIDEFGNIKPGTKKSKILTAPFKFDLEKMLGGTGHGGGHDH